MDDDTSPARTVDRLIGMRLSQFQRVTGLPAVFGGAAAAAPGGRELRIAHVRGTLGRSLIDLRVGSGRGLGGSVLASGGLRMVNDYAGTRAITHDFDDIVVRQERISAIFALPVMAGGAVGGIVYGAVRGSHRIGDVVLDRAARFGTALERELTGLSAPPTSCPAAPAGLRHTRAAIGELARVARTVNDAAVRDRLDQLIADLRELVGDDARAADAGGPRSLAPREVEVLGLVAVGMANAEVAAALSLSTETVRAYLRSAMRKLDVGNRTAAVHRARQLDLL